jgi:hypothetical protein
MSEIRLRAITQIGKLSRELEKSEGGRPSKTPDTGGQSFSKEKQQQIEEAGLKVRTANRYEQLAAPDAQCPPQCGGPAFLAVHSVDRQISCAGRLVHSAQEMLMWYTALARSRAEGRSL